MGSLDRTEWHDVIESVSDTDSCSSKLTAQEIREESPLVYKVFDLAALRQKPEWAHIKEKADSNPAEVADPNNRLILSPEFHTPYDGRDGETGVPGLSFVYLGDDPPRGREITLHVVFATPDMAEHLSCVLKNPMFCGDRSYTCTLTHPDPPGFVAYLNERHNANQARNPLLTPTTH